MKVNIDGRNIVLTGVTDFNIEQTLECGQCFHFERLHKDEYVLAAYGRLLHVKQKADTVCLYETSYEDYKQIWENYFDLTKDYQQIKKCLISTSERLEDAVNTMSGVHILKQEFFETLISFIISQNKQIPHIKKIVKEISYRYGNYLGNVQGNEMYAFPTIEQLLKVSEDELRDCKVGFRAPYIVDAVRQVNEGKVDYKELIKADLEHCEEMLTRIKGVGVKVANCVMLFSLDKTEAFPVDVWIKRIMQFIYFNGEEKTKEEISLYAHKIFGEYAGYAQQYLFYFGKEQKLGTE